MRARTPSTPSAPYAGVLYPYQQSDITIKVKVEEPAGTVTTLANGVSVEGGGAPHAASSIQRVTDQRRADTVRGAGARL